MVISYYSILICGPFGRPTYTTVINFLINYDFQKIASAFSPSRLWGPEEPMARYVWMSQKYANEVQSSDNDNHSEPINYSQIVFNNDNEKSNDWFKPKDDYQSPYYIQNKNGYLDNSNSVFKDVTAIYAPHSIPRSKKKKKDEEKFRSPNVCIAKAELGGLTNCNCNRHFTLNVPDLRKNEVTTIL